MPTSFINTIKISALSYYRDRVYLSAQAVAYVDIKLKRMQMDYLAK